MELTAIKSKIRQYGVLPILKKNLRHLGNTFEKDEEYDTVKQILLTVAGRDLFIINESNARLLNILICYFFQDERLKLYPEIDIQKGIMIIGKKGVGKTTIFNIFNEFLPMFREVFPVPRFSITSVEKIKEYYITNGKYNEFTGYEDTKINKRHLVINEFGVQYDIKHFGSSFNDIMNSILMLRYEIFKDHGVLTHGTSNLDTEEMKQVFDPILLDRIKEMFNIIELKGESFRK